MNMTQSKSQQRRVEHRPELSRREAVEVLANRGHAEHAAQVMEQKQLEARSARLRAEIAQMKADFARGGRRNPRYAQAESEFARIKHALSEVAVAFQMAKAARREAENAAIRDAHESKAEVFIRFAQLMLADDVFMRISRAAGQEWDRLYRY